VADIGGIVSFPNSEKNNFVEIGNEITRNTAG